MADFDLDSYLNRRYGNPGTDKIDALEAATESKLALLGQYRDGKADATRKVREATLGGMLGLDPAGVPGTVANMMASFANRAVGIGSGLAQAPFANAALKRGAAIPAEVLQAHANLRAGQATEQDKVLLATPIADDNLGAGGIESMANPAWDTNQGAPLPQTTWFDRVNSVEGHAKMAADVKKAADTSFLVDHTRQKAQETQFMADAAPGIAQVRKGAQDFTNGSLGGVIGGAAGMVAGTFNAAKYLPQAAVDHPVATGEIVAGVLPDALIGGYGGIHGTLAATFPDAQNTLTSGVAAYQKAHGGNLPPKEWYSVNGAKAAAWMGADVLSDRMMLNGGKGLEAAGESAAKALTRMSPAESRNAFTKALFGTANLAKRPATAAGAIVEGAGGEFFAEGAQQYLEDSIAGKESSIEDIYRSAATGALGGGGISSGVGMSKLLESGPAAVKPPVAALNPVDTPEQKATFEAAIASNDPSAFLDQASPSYNPVKAVSVLQANNDNADTAPEVKQANYQQAQTIVTDLDSQLENAKEDYQFARKSPAAKQAEVDFYKAELAKIDPADTEGKATYETMVAHYEGMLAPLTAAQVRSTEADLSRMDRQLKEARTVKGQMVPPVTPEAFAQQVAAVQAPVDPQDAEAITASKAAATSLINLSMASPELLTPEVAKQLYKSTSSGLDDSQREYLRVFSEARIAQNALQDSDSVHQTILYGDKKNDQAGLVQHRERITDALEASNKKAAERGLKTLNSFAVDQQGKLTAMQAALDSDAVQKNRQTVQVVKNKDTGQWEQYTGDIPLTEKERVANGGLNIHRGSGKIVGSIAAGATAISTAAAEMEAAYGLKFGNVSNKANKTNTSAAPVQKTKESIQVPSVESTTPPLSTSIDNKVLEGRERVSTKVLPLSAGKANWSRYAPAGTGYEVSTQGDTRFSALNAKLADGRTIEEAYQLDVKGFRDPAKLNQSWKDGKGKAPKTSLTPSQTWEAYKGLWQQWAKENPKLIQELRAASAGKTLTDKFAGTPVSQARALAEILAAEASQETQTAAPDTYTNHSGGAIGADSMFDTVGKSLGFTKHQHYFHGASTPKGNVRLTNDQVNEGIVHAKAAASVLARPWNDRYASLLGRNWFQVKNATQIIAVAPLVKPGERNSKGFISKAKRTTVDGGTGYAVEMAIAAGKEVHVFDTKTNQWFLWDGAKFKTSTVPVLAQNYAGIGSRQDNGTMTPESIQAIKDVYAKASAPNQVSTQATPTQAATKIVAVEQPTKAQDAPAALTATQAQYDEAIWVSQSVEEEDYGSVSPEILALVKAFDNETPINIVAAKAAPTVLSKAASGFTKSLKQVNRAIRKAKRQNLRSLWTALKHSINEKDLNDIYGSDWKKRYTFLRGKPGRSLVDAIADGELDEFLPHKLRFGLGNQTEYSEVGANQEQEAEEYIKEKLRNRDYLTEDTLNLLYQLDVTVQELTEALTLQEIEDAIQSTQAEISAEEKPGNAQTPATARESTAGSVEPDVETEAASSVTPAEESAPPAEEVAGYPGLEALQEKSPEGTTYTTRNLLADFFTQAKEREGDASVRPLVAVKDFISSLRDKTQAIKVSDFLQEKDRDLDDVQKDLVRLLETKVKDWSPILQRNLVKGYWDNTSKTAKDNDEFKFHDLMQFLVQGTNATGLDLEENVKTAIVYAAMKVIADTGNDVEFNTPDDINKMLGREKGTEISDDEGALLARAGLRENIWRNNAGKAAVTALGFKPTQDAGMDLLPRLESAFGAYIEKLLMDQHMLVRTRLTVDEMNQLFPPAELAEGQAPAKVAPWQMLKLARDDKGNLTEQAAEILEASFGTRSILDKLFSVQSRLDYPSLAPAPFKQSSTAGASEGVPANIAKALDEKQSEENFIRDDYWNVVDVLSEAGFESAILEIAGHVDTETAVVHAGQLLSMEAKNAGIVRELRQAKEFVKDSLLRVSGLLAEVPMFFKYSVWKQQRVGLANTGFNPQASKLQRAMYYKKDWKQTIQLDNEASLNNFRLRVSEAMGVKTDGETSATTLAGFEALFDPEAKDSSGKAQDTASKEKATQRMAAIRVLQKITYAGTKPTADEVKTLVKGVKVGGEKSATMVVFLDMAHYLQAKESKAASFTHYMQAEVDGKTNGIILSQLLFGGARSVADMQERMRRGGFFFEGDEHTQFNLWKVATKNLDQYEALTRRIVQVAQTMVAKNPEVFAALEAFIKPLEVAGKIAKAGRDLTKNPLTTLMFGAKLHSATDKIGDKVIAEIYQTMVDVKTGKSPLTIKEVLDHLNTLLYAGNGEPMDEHMTVDQALTVQLSYQQIKAIKKAFHQTLGKAAKQAISETFSNYLLNREVMDEAAKLIFELSDAAIQALRADYIQELVTAGTLDTRKGKVIRALTHKEEQTFQKRIAKLLPLVHTAGSKRDGNIAHGVTLASTVSVLSTDEVFQGTAAFGTPFVDTIGSRDKNGKSREAYKTTLNSSERVQKAPRTGPASKFVHSLDSSTSHDAQMGRQTQNNHDALISGLEGFTDTAVGLNQALWNNLTEYSPMQEVLNTLTGLIRNITEMAVDSDKQVLSAGAKANLANVLNALGTTYGMAPDAALNAVLTDLANTAYRADKLKLEVLAKAISVDQYTLEGGNFVPTEKDIQKVNNNLAALSQEIPLDVTEAVDSLTAMLKDKLVLPKPRTTKAGRETLWGPIGNPTTSSDPYLLKVFAKHKTLTAEQLVKVLRNRFPTNTVNREILDRLAPLLDKGLTVKYIEPGAKESDVLAMPEQASRGWYIATEDGQQVIYVLSSEFQNSGVTAELLLHEALHAALAQTLRNPSAAAELLIAELDTLRGKALGVINSDKALAQFLPAVSSVDELISWGLTNKEFQVKVLSQVRMQSMTKKNILVQGMEAFINLITGLLFRNPSSKQQHGVSVLVNNVAGLLAEATLVNAPVAVNQSMAAPSAGVTTADLYEALENPTQPLSSSFDEHLRSLLDGMVSKLHGPFGSFKQAIMTAQPLGPLERMAKAQAEGKAPLTVSALVSGIRFSDQEAFVMEQVQATVKATLEGNDGQTAITYGELSKLFMEAKKRIVPADFATGDPAQDRAIHDFLFNHTDAGKGNRSDYLARFAAVGLAHEGFNKLLQVETSRAAPVLKGEKTIAAFLKRAFDSLLDWFNGRMSNTQPGQKGNDKLMALVEQLVQIELKRQARAADTSFDIVDAFDEKSKALADGVAAKLGEIGKSAFFQQSRSKVLKASGSLVSMVAEDRVKWLVEGMNKFRDQYMDKEQGVIAAVFKDVVGYAAQQQVLLRMAVKNQGERKDIITNATKLVRESFVNQGKDLTDQAKSALTSVLLRTGAHTLLSPTFDTAQLQELLNDVNKLTAAIKTQEAKLGVFPARFQNYFLRQSKDLAHYLVHSEAKGQHLMLNAGNIARMYETIHQGKLSAAETTQAEAIIDSLVSLYALKMSSTDSKAEVVAMMKAEHARGDGGNGVQMALLLHKDMEQQAKERLFGDSPALMVKGYTPEIYNPYTAIQVADSGEGKLLLEQGYMAGDYVKQDPDDPREEQKRIYVLRDGGAQPLQTGILSYTGTRHKGSTLHSGKNVKMQKQVLLDKQVAIDKMFEPNPTYDPAKGRGTHMVPLLNATGKAVNYHYMMTAKTKDALLERNSRFDDVLGVQAGSVFDKATVGEQNRKAIQALRDMYLEDFKNNPGAYVQVGPTSPDAENRELYKLLPKVTQQAIIDIWGKEGLMVRSDHKDLYFGYHKLSLSSAWDKVDPNLMERALVTSVTWALENYAKYYLHMDGNQAKQYAKRGAVVVRRGENIWQAVVREIKDIYVIKAVTSMLNNIVSNLSLLSLNGVPVLDSLRYHQEAMRGVSDYERDTTELFRLEQQIKVGMGDVKASKQRIIELNDAIARNPVKPLIDAGLMPTIVEDVEADVDPFSYKSQFLRKTEKYTSKLNPKVRQAARVAFMAHDTQAYKTLHHFTQLSDFVARYALYQHLTTRKKNALASPEALHAASEAFIFYDIPLHRKLQYVEDMGLVMFTKYFIRIQRVLAQRVKENPGRVLTSILTHHFIGGVPGVMDASAIAHFGNNPLSTGALGFPGALPDLGTVQAMDGLLGLLK